MRASITRRREGADWGAAIPSPLEGRRDEGGALSSGLIILCAHALRHVHGLVQHAEDGERGVIVGEDDDVACLLWRDAARAGVAEVKEVDALLEFVVDDNAGAFRVSA